MRAVFEKFAADIVARNDDHLLDYGPEEQIAKAVEALEKFSKTTPIALALPGHMIDLAGFGAAPVHFEGTEDRYLLLSEVAEALGVPVWEACDWADKQQLHALQDQRGLDEERGDGRLGWECLRGYCDLNLSFVVHHADDYPGAEPDANGKKWDFYGDWLISHDRLLAFIADSPWSKEFMTNMSDLFAHGMKKFFGDDIKDLPAYRADGTPATAADMFHTDLTEEEARQKARRGPRGDFLPPLPPSS
ncbi:hypothetical protein ACIBCT_20780 [Streptosporangium sp. NPDC050855]|uniref:hypothetical protein n=1 Tax=Streptosporangium sp. NPDC050855 TaxID=3366194 RepID=UPI003797EBAF